MDRAEANRLRKQFQAIDLNQDGLITLDEMQEFSNGVLEDQFRTLLGRNVNWRELFSILDHDNDGQISYREFVAGAADKSNLLSAESLRKAFDALDINADGLITQEDINKRLEKKAAADIEAYKELSDDIESEAFWGEFLRDFDQSGVSFEAFKRNMIEIVEQHERLTQIRASMMHDSEN